MPLLSSHAISASESIRAVHLRIDAGLAELTRAGLLMRSTRHRQPMVYARRLTDLRCRVLWLLDDDVRAADIAAKLGISVGAVERHCTRLRTSLGGGRIGMETLREIAWLWKTGELQIVRPVEKSQFKI